MGKLEHLITLSALSLVLSHKIYNLKRNWFLSNDEWKLYNDWTMGFKFYEHNRKIEILACEIIDFDKHISLSDLQKETLDDYFFLADSNILDDNDKMYCNLVIEHQYRQEKFIDKLANHGIDSWVYS